MRKSMQYSIRSETGRWGEYWFISELARRGVRAQRLNEFETGTDVITQENQLIEIKTSIAHHVKAQKGSRTSRGWAFNSIRKDVTRESDVFVFIALSDKDFRKIEHIWIVPREELISQDGGTKTGFFIKDTAWQLKNLPDVNRSIGKKWIEDYEDNWEIIWQPARSSRIDYPPIELLAEENV